MRVPGLPAPPGLEPPAAKLAYVQGPSPLEHENLRLTRENALLRQRCLQADISAVAAAASVWHLPDMASPPAASPVFSVRGPASAKQVKASAANRCGQGRPAGQHGKGQPPKAAAPKADAAASPEPPRSPGEDLSRGDPPDTEEAAGRTTVMLRNLPNNLSRSMLRELFDVQGFAADYDFLYLPIDFKSQANLGYAFLNLISEDRVAPFWRHFDGFTGWARASQKVCSVLWSSPHQGLEVHIERNRNNPVMHEDVPDSHKPLLLKHGEEIPFPPPTRKLRAPRIRASRAAGVAPQKPPPCDGTGSPASGGA